MELKVIGKRLFTERLDKTITEGEYNADVIGITLDRYHDGADLSEYSFRITAYSENSEAIAEQVLSKGPAGEKSIRLVWTVSPTFAAASGIFTLTLAGVAPDNSAQIKFTSSPVRINADGRAEFIPEKTLAEQYLNQVQLEAQKAVDAAKRAEDAASQSFEIPAATEEKIGGILSGGDVSVGESGAVTVNSVGGKTIEANVPADAKVTDTVYTLPKATEKTLGGVKVDGKTVTADKNGVISAAEKYVLPTATATVLGGVKVDGKTITAKNGVISAVVGTGGGNGDSGYVLPAATDSSLGGVIVDGKTIIADENGIISAVGGTDGNEDYVLPAATDSSLGGVIVDGITITADENGVISALVKDYTLPAATENTLGGVKPDGSTISASGGVISVADNSHNHTIANISGLQNALNGKADISAIPASLPANGGNAATVGGFTVGTNVPADAQFTDTVYTLPTASANVLGGVKVDGTTITADAGGVISALAAGGSGITIDKIFEQNTYWTRFSSEAAKTAYVKLPYEVTYWDYVFISTLYTSVNSPWFGYCGSVLVKTSDIIYASKDPSTLEANKAVCQYLLGKLETNGSRIEVCNKTHIKVVYLDQVVIWGIKAPSITSQTMAGTVVSSAEA